MLTEKIEKRQVYTARQKFLEISQKYTQTLENIELLAQREKWCAEIPVNTHPIRQLSKCKCNSLFFKLCQNTLINVCVYYVISLENSVEDYERL